MTVTFTVQGKPQGKGRPRIANGHCYTPQKTRDYENLIAQEYKRQVKAYFANVPLMVQVTAIMPIPKATNKADKAEMLADNILPMGKPDIDNICKAVLDGLNGVAYADDTQVVTLSAKKVYEQGEGLLIISITNLTN